MTVKKNTKETRVYVGRSFLVRSISQASLFLLIFVVLSLVQIRAQESSGESSLAVQSEAAKEDSYKLRRGDHEFTVWGAGSFDAPTPIGSTYRPIVMLGFRYGRVLGTNHLGTLEYVADVIPIQVVSNQQYVPAPRESTYGVGINYGGLKVSYLRRSRVKPFVGASGGLIVYNRPVPLEGRKLNFTYSLDVGLDVFTSKKRAFTAGYRFYHASDAVHTKANIGTNDNVISIGFSFFR